jgi:cytidylate kinase
MISIAIDGPAASGKTTLSKTLAESLEFLYFDTGAMYRAVTLAALDEKLDLNDEQAIVALAETAEIDLQAPSQEDGRLYDVILNGKDSTWRIRSKKVDQNVSLISAYPGVRAALTKQQQRIGKRGGVVMAGRDIGTVVLPNAELKIYLDASVEERARRRYEELTMRGEEVELASIEEDMRQRDETDTNRKVAPLKAASDAIVIRSDGKLANEVLDQAIQLATERMEAAQ